ncbi:hypothetical protein DHD32_12865 [Arenibacter sp. TNZ]|nr:hypothetical protein [Arenibacter sp. TNZ]
MLQDVFYSKKQIGAFDIRPVHQSGFYQEHDNRKTLVVNYSEDFLNLKWNTILHNKLYLANTKV